MGKRLLVGWVKKNSMWYLDTMMATGAASRMTIKSFIMYSTLYLMEYVMLPEQTNCFHLVVPRYYCWQEHIVITRRYGLCRKQKRQFIHTYATGRLHGHMEQKIVAEAE